MFFHEVSFSGHVLNDEIVEDAARPTQTGKHIKRLQWQMNCTETNIRKIQSLNPEYNQAILFITSYTITNSQDTNILVQVSTEDYKKLPAITQAQLITAPPFQNSTTGYYI